MSLIITIVLLRVTPPHRITVTCNATSSDHPNGGACSDPSSRSRLVSRETERETDETRHARIRRGQKPSKTKTMLVLPALGVSPDHGMFQ